MSYGQYYCLRIIDSLCPHPIIHYSWIAAPCSSTINIDTDQLAHSLAAQLPRSTATRSRRLVHEPPPEVSGVQRKTRFRRAAEDSGVESCGWEPSNEIESPRFMIYVIISFIAIVFPNIGGNYSPQLLANIDP